MSPAIVRSPDASGAEATHNVLDGLLSLTLPIRDLYESARCQVADTVIGHLCPLFETHSAQQQRLVDVLCNRIHGLGGAGYPAQSAYVWRRLDPGRLLCALLDAHTLVLDAAEASRPTHPSADPDRAIGWVVLTNDLQRQSITEQLTRLQL